MTWVGGVPFEEIGMTQEKMDLLKVLAEDSDYWRDALRFVTQTTSRKLSSLTDRQRNWLFDIDATLAVELNKRTAREVFDGNPGPC